jgi:2-amino-4-hydroxy-6-hydroxymethyldihydropteridine diphosphokinase
LDPARFPVAIALGSNLGDRQAHLAFAVRALTDTLTDLSASSWYETAPVGVPPQGHFLNGAAVGWTSLPPRALLDRLLQIERDAGRQRPFDGAPRTLDLDLILYGSDVIDEPGLVIPHPRFRDRLFVLEPLAEIASEWIDPVTGLSIGALRDAIRRTE